MNLPRRLRICWLSFLLPLIFLSSNGCSTDQSGITASKDLEKYRKVYLVRPKGDDRNLAAGVLSRLKVAGFDASEIDAEALKKIAAAKEATEPTLVCHFSYVTTWDYERTWYSFMSIDIAFSDLAKDQVVFRVGRNNYNFQNLQLPENTDLNRLFIKIRDGFFPGQPNPLRDNLKGPYGPSYHQFPTDI
jgi:hypothetical protein